MAEVPETRLPKNVVIAFDGSDHAKHALKFYAEKLHMPGDHVFLVYSVEVSDVIQQAPFNMDPEVFKDLVQKEVKRIQGELIEFAKYLRQMKLEGTVKSTHAEKPGEGILNIAKEVNASLIITGSRGQSKLRRTFLGSVSDYVMHHSPVPVLVCRKEN
ncbi:universal stress protein in QAH/OAS sulfhydrylase 3'region-like isoform X2 [Saccostrea echinata]|uniref:universal stress protein in QAH/OAS sulfhydrylase 3'region-like isoform X2 n=1 Tax=Saccostrea echinata TaxID=191078 RepID=UPI002A7EE0BF|nr:universal stress protein in QAH/OAS sulfhydrylase 3'region-like isoform X2 [Saccostrea echinata]